MSDMEHDGLGMSLAQIDQQNDLPSNQIQVGQTLVVAPPSLGAPAGDDSVAQTAQKTAQ